MEKQIKRFEVGKRYMMRSACNQDCVWMYTVVSRTETTVVLQQLRMGKPYGDQARFRINKGSSEIWGAEVERLQAKLDELTDLQEKMKAANKIIRSKKLSEVEKVDELMAIGLSEAMSLKCLEPDFAGRYGFLQYALSNNLAKIKDTEAKMKRHERMASQEDEIHRHNWGELHVDYSDERYRFLFDDKPSQEVIGKMKEHGYKWSPANKAWQRQITPNAAYSTKKLLEELERILTENEK